MLQAVELVRLAGYSHKKWGLLQLYGLPSFPHHYAGLNG